MSVEYFPPSAFDELVGVDALQAYHWGDRMVNHWFCRTCGIHPFHDAIAEPGHYRINLRCIDGLDSSSLEIIEIDGASF